MMAEDVMTGELMLPRMKRTRLVITDEADGMKHKADFRDKMRV